MFRFSDFDEISERYRLLHEIEAQGQDIAPLMRFLVDSRSARLGTMFLVAVIFGGYELFPGHDRREPPVPGQLPET